MTGRNALEGLAASMLIALSVLLRVALMLVALAGAVATALYLAGVGPL